ncbi:MAG: hypothetical protein IJ864_04110, partial [Alphaproteobacteria bacterium]|nr:hypothetical protein [Alphaproteobacteria bacterium]
MENLSDVEFGSDKSSEEAPILVAQRYLNIFRQVHIFKKEKRNQFDDELLALPKNITDLFKKMPGGRLLVEHIEDVKTQRGIAFEKSKREDFVSGNDEPSANTLQETTAINAQIASNAAPAVSNVVMDTSFAETFATAMADAFKQLPVGNNGENSVATVLPTDFSKAFELIAEEIKSSRASLLDVLQETRSITDSVIASQVSISRMLESLLSSQDNRGQTDAHSAQFNEKIIASQTAITKLLENLCSSYTQNVSASQLFSESLETRLAQFKEQMTSYLSQSLADIRKTVETDHNQLVEALIAQTEEKAAINYDDRKTEIVEETPSAPSIVTEQMPETKEELEPVMAAEKTEYVDNNAENSDALVAPVEKKKKKKKK